MKDFTYVYPTKVYFGDGAAAKALPAELAKVGEDSDACLWRWFRKTQWCL